MRKSLTIKLNVDHYIQYNEHVPSTIDENNCYQTYYGETKYFYTQNQLVPTVPHSLNRLWSLSAIYNALLFCLSFGVVSEVEEHQ